MTTALEEWFPDAEQIVKRAAEMRAANPRVKTAEVIEAIARDFNVLSRVINQHVAYERGRLKVADFISDTQMAVMMGVRAADFSNYLRANLDEKRLKERQTLIRYGRRETYSGSRNP